jgi:hypothetical protein
MDQIEIVLGEVRALRDDVRELRDELSTNAEATSSRLTQLETWVKPALVNNGQPSRIAALEARVAALERHWTKVVAVGSALWAALALALRFLPWGHH